MKMHIGVVSQTGLVHRAVVTAANVYDKHPLPELLHGNKRHVYGDSASASQKELIESKAPRRRASSSTSVCARTTTASSNARKTATNPNSVPASSMLLRCSGIQPCALPRHALSWHQGCRTSTSREGTRLSASNAGASSANAAQIAVASRGNIGPPPAKPRQRGARARRMGVVSL